MSKKIILLRVAPIIAAYLCAYIALSLFSHEFKEIQGVVAWYPPAGLTYTLLIVFGAKFTPIVTIALLIDSVFVYRMPQPLYLLFLWSLIISLIYCLVAWFLRQRIRLDWQLRKLRDVVWLIATAVCASALLALLSVSSSALSSDMPQSEIFRSFFIWWIGEAVGVLTIAPFLLIHVIPWLKGFVEGRPVRLPVRRPSPRSTLLIIGQALSIALIFYWVFSVNGFIEFRPVYLIALPLFWIALAHGFKGATIAIVIVNFGASIMILSFRFDLVYLGEFELLMIINCIAGLMMGVVITERKQTEMALFKREQEFRALAENNLDVIERFDKEFRYFYVNHLIETGTGVSAATAIGMTIRERGFPADIVSLYEQAIQYIFETGKEKLVETSQLVNGEMRYYESRWAPEFAPDGSVETVLCISHDITNRKKAEEEIRAFNANLELRVLKRTEELAAVNKELEAFSYSVSHDLRAPLRSIEGFSTIFMNEYGAAIPEKGREYLERVRRNALHMGQLIDSMLDLSRLTRSEMYLKKTDVSALATRVAEELTVENPNRNVQVDIEPGMTALVDPQLLRIVLTNLLNNAWKFTSKHEHAQVRVGTVMDLRHGAVFFVRDDGVGFNNEYKDKLFSAFQRLHSEKDYPGTGIGLATIARIVHRHGGEVWAESEVDKGATFYFSIPNPHATIPGKNEKQ